jgi:hypothetical protein
VAKGGSAEPTANLQLFGLVWYFCVFVYSLVKYSGVKAFKNVNYKLKKRIFSEEE